MGSVMEMVKFLLIPKYYLTSKIKNKFSIIKLNEKSKMNKLRINYFKDFNKLIHYEGVLGF